MNILHNKIIKKIEFLFKTIPEVDFIFFTGSIVNKQTKKFSDVDLWIITNTEEGWYLIVSDIHRIFSKFNKILGIYKCTEYHFFIVFQNGLQIDLNIVTLALYTNLTTLPGKKDSYFSSKKLKENVQCEVEAYLLKGYGILQRSIGKYHQNKYILSNKLIESLRYEVILPLYSISTNQIKYNITIADSIKLTPKYYNLFLSTYSIPERRACKKSFKFILRILMDYRKKYNIDKFIKLENQILAFLKDKNS